MKIKLFGICVSILILIGCDKKAPQNIDLTKFLPDKNSTSYYYRTTMVNEPQYPEFHQKDILTKEIIVSRKNNCVNKELYVLFDTKEVSEMTPDMKEHIKDNQMRSPDETLCADDEKLTSSGYVFYHNKGSWNNHARSIDTNGSIQKLYMGECSFVDFTKKIIFEKEREVIHTKCKYDGGDIKTEQENYIAEGLGVYKTIVKSDINFGNIKSHSVMTISLVKYE